MTSAKDRLNQTLPGLSLLPIVLEVALLDAAAHLPADVAAAVPPDAATRLSDLAAVLGQTYLPWRETTVLFAPTAVLRYQCRFAAQSCLSVALALFFNHCRPIGK